MGSSLESGLPFIEYCYLIVTTPKSKTAIEVNCLRWRRWQSRARDPTAWSLDTQTGGVRDFAHSVSVRASVITALLFGNNICVYERLAPSPYQSFMSASIALLSGRYLQLAANLLAWRPPATTVYRYTALSPIALDRYRRASARCRPPFQTRAAENDADNR